MKSLQQANFTGTSKSIERVIYYSALADFIQVANACQYGEHLRLERGLEHNSGEPTSLELVINRASDILLDTCRFYTSNVCQYGETRAASIRGSSIEMASECDVTFEQYRTKPNYYHSVSG